MRICVCPCLCVCMKLQGELVSLKSEVEFLRKTKVTDAPTGLSRLDASNLNLYDTPPISGTGTPSSNITTRGDSVPKKTAKDTPSSNASTPYDPRFPSTTTPTSVTPYDPRFASASTDFIRRIARETMLNSRMPTTRRNLGFNTPSPMIGGFPYGMF